MHAWDLGLYLSAVPCLCMAISLRGCLYNIHGKARQSNRPHIQVKSYSVKVGGAKVFVCLIRHTAAKLCAACVTTGPPPRMLSVWSVTNS